MNVRPRDCALLRPALVAYVHGEQHPEARKLLEHLPRCRSCQAEEAELRETREWIAAAMEEDVRGRWPHAREIVAHIASPWHAATALAAILVVCLLALGGRRDGAEEVSGRLESVLPLQPAAPLAGDAFLGGDIDRRLELLERRLALLTESETNPWSDLW
ncbi:MAG TPA: hypothetical protein VMT52_02290 [Planctomycetota bacterium]|nr:hypothetical protein [Planctomycetota bacterium]